MGWFLFILMACVALIICAALVSFFEGRNQTGKSRTRQGNSYSSVIYGSDSGFSSSDSGGCDGPAASQAALRNAHQEKSFKISGYCLQYWKPYHSNFSA